MALVNVKVSAVFGRSVDHLGPGIPPGYRAYGVEPTLKIMRGMVVDRPGRPVSFMRCTVTLPRPK
jgi:hypothetical protein